ncbi:hypothetical protein [[Actinomadura] parvosata]
MASRSAPNWSALLGLALIALIFADGVLARRHGVRVRSIRLWMLGGFSELEDQPPDPRADLVIAAAGPVVGAAARLLLGGGYLLGEALSASPLLTRSLLWLAAMNGVLAVFNPAAGRVSGRRAGAACPAVVAPPRPVPGRARRRPRRAYPRPGLRGTGPARNDLLQPEQGIWTVLIGWFLTSSAGAGGTAHLVRGALSGATVADVMHRSPACAQAWHTLQSCAEQTVADSDQDVFPVVELAGDPVGVIAADRIIAVPAQRRAELHVRSVMTPLPRSNVLTPDAPAAGLTGLRPLGPLVAVVAEGGPRHRHGYDRRPAALPAPRDAGDPVVPFRLAVPVTWPFQEGAP